MAFKMKHSSPLSMINKGKKDNTKDGGRMSASEASASAKPDMEVTITAKKKTVPRGYAAPAGDVKKGRKVKEIKKERKFDTVSLSQKEKQGAKGAKWAKTKTYSVQNVKFN